ncbi:PaaI family thioesterase [Agrococcus jejuensis]|uniref:PaaI family thioesterase n=1 Tax=Agrococcus jejuensis TaxID=399736 RepID=UPI003F796B51
MPSAVAADPGASSLLGERGRGELAERMGIEFTELSAERSVATMPAEGNRQPIGLIHGGAYCVLAESLGSMSANAHAIALGRYAVGIDINATHTRSVRSGTVTGTCTAVHLGSTMTVHEIVITDESGARISTARITNLLRDRR